MYKLKPRGRPAAVLTIRQNMKIKLLVLGLMAGSALNAGVSSALVLANFKAVESPVSMKVGKGGNMTPIASSSLSTLKYAIIPDARRAFILA